jgi:hypothetical protein
MWAARITLLEIKLRVGTSGVLPPLEIKLRVGTSGVLPPILEPKVNGCGMK